jgi:hypothetical protein
LVEATTSVAIGTDCIGSCKSNYITIMATTAPNNITVIQTKEKPESNKGPTI